MDRKRFGLVMMIVAGGMLALALYAQHTQPPREAAENSPAANTAATNAEAVTTTVGEPPVAGPVLTAAAEAAGAADQPAVAVDPVDPVDDDADDTTEFLAAAAEPTAEPNH